MDKRQPLWKGRDAQSIFKIVNAAYSFLLLLFFPTLVDIMLSRVMRVKFLDNIINVSKVTKEINKLQATRLKQ